MGFFSLKSNSGVDYIVVGLGNPDEKYMRTRHNTGFLALDCIAERAGIQVKKLKHYALTGKGNISGKSVLLMKPQRYMNNSGESVGDAASFYKVKPENIIVIFDDISLEAGEMRIRRKGSAGGHNGLKSINDHLGTEDYPRIKIGIGAKPYPEYDLADWVLSRITEQDMKKIAPRFDNAYDALCLMLDGKTDAAMNKYNGNI